ncbi:hypothetical protein BH09VER1_BH09VER1_03420 [soil metagenome]
MRKLPLVLFIAAGSVFAQQKDLQLDAVRAYGAGDYTTAKSLFEALLSENPRNTSAQTYLKMIAAKQREGGGLEATLKKVIIPKVDLHDSTVQEAVTFVAQRVKDITKGKQVVNVVWLVPPADTNSAVTLTLENVPATEVLQYIADIAKLKLEYDPMALKIKPAADPATAAAAPAPTP